jgi:muramoyltetrapeptide carboxypeptidase
MPAADHMTRRELIGNGAKALISATIFSKGMDKMAQAKPQTKHQAQSKNATLAARPEGKNLLKPKALKPGDRVALLCPAGRPHNPASINRARAIVEEMGFKPVVGKNALKIFGTMAGTDEERLSDFNDALTDDSIAGIFCVTGGYGALHLVDKIDWDKLKQNPKVIAGSDDICHLLLAACARTGIVSFHAPNMDRISSRESFDSLKQAVTSKDPLPVVQSNYWGIEASTDGSSETKARLPDDKWQIAYSYAAVEGVAEGALLGGNLTALGSLMGTPYQPSFKNAVLFLEDINEDHGVLDRWFTNLYLAGALGEVSGIALGDFENCRTKECFNMYSLEDLFGDRMKQQNKPCCFGMPLGQSARSLAAPIGVRVKLDATRGNITYLDSAVS